ncbi:MAG: selenocysteine-specific translation elongation factor [Calditrichales bacterium]|nr:selenocysteine-specific translation elongation factor [Calditrichales bacterium]
MDKHTIIGMAGHIDHGKTALIKALTGIETDRLKEEQERGITIDIGFAYWKDNVTIIDVPGHEKFVRNMVAGVSTVDLFLLVIAADDGIMPQTIEHLDILKFFGVRDGIVAINKIDLVDEEWNLLMLEEVTEFLQKNGFEKIPVIPVSAVNKNGIEELHAALLDKIKNKHRTENARPFRLNIDRNFSAKGFGAIVTGTVLSSNISTGGKLVTLPAKRETKVRGLQVHQHTAEKAYMGQRTAINLSNISMDELQRGTALVEPDSLEPTQELLAEIITTANIKFKIKRHSNVRIHLGTAEIVGRIDWFDDARQLDTNQTYHVRIRLSEAGVAAPGDPVLIRSFSPVTTIAGGKVLQIDPPRLPRDTDTWKAYFDTLARGDIPSKIQLIFEFSGYRTITLNEIQQALFEKKQTTESAASKLEKQKIIFSFDYKNEVHFIHNKSAARAVEIIKEILDKTLSDQKYKKGLNFKELYNHLKHYHFTEPFLERVLQKAVNIREIFFDGEVYSAEDIIGSEKMVEVKQQIAAFYKKCRFNAPDLKQLSDKFNLDQKDLKAFTLELAKNGVLKSIGGQFYLHIEVFNELIDFLKTHFNQNEHLEVTVIRDFGQSSRKYIIPLLEYLDNMEYTIRQGDTRVKGRAL